MNQDDDWSNHPVIQNEWSLRNSITNRFSNYLLSDGARLIQKLFYSVKIKEHKQPKTFDCGCVQLAIVHLKSVHHIVGCCKVQNI